MTFMGPRGSRCRYAGRVRRPDRLAVRILATFSAATFAAAAFAAFGCGQSSYAPYVVQGQVGRGSVAQAGVCPDTLEATSGARCDTEGLVCGPQYTCEGLVATARCTCSGGTFDCLDGTGKLLDGPDAAPACAARPAAQACPPTVAKAALVPCTEPYLVCTYPKECDAAPAFRQCTCAMGPLPNGSEGFAFRCPDDCPYVGTPIVTPIVTVADAAADAGADAATD